MQHDKDKSKAGKASRPEFEVAYFTRELGRPLQRQMLARQLAGFSEAASGSARGHGEDQQIQATASTPREDRAG